jgi:predicted RNA methylase
LSATNRGAKRKESDFYPTPVSVVQTFLSNYKIKDGTILEPCAGNGNFIKAIREFGYNNNIIANELREIEVNNLIEAGANEVYTYNFLENKISEYPTTIITNPPFSIAEEFIRKCKTQFPNSEIIMLLRVAFLESQKRYDFWQQYPVNKLYVLKDRPSFTGKGTDASAYGFFVWDGTDKQEIKVI